jgi:20S proteasome alpha/beta subunit
MILQQLSFFLLLLTLLSVWKFAGSEVFDANGRLIQVENAFQATLKSERSIMVTKGKESIFILTVSPKIFDYSVDNSKILPLRKQSYICGTGIASDIRYLTNKLFELSLDHTVRYHTEMPIERLANELSSTIHENTLSQQTRPFGVSLILFGSNDLSSLSSSNNYKIIELDPLGNMHDCVVSCVGKQLFSLLFSLSLFVVLFA